MVPFPTETKHQSFLSGRTLSSKQCFLFKLYKQICFKLQKWAKQRQWLSLGLQRHTRNSSGWRDSRGFRLSSFPNNLFWRWGNLNPMFIFSHATHTVCVYHSRCVEVSTVYQEVPSGSLNQLYKTKHIYKILPLVLINLKYVDTFNTINPKLVM